MRSVNSMARQTRSTGFRAHNDRYLSIVNTIMLTIPSYRQVAKVLKRHIHFLGPGLVSSVAYIDPGNWATDLSAGANYGYKLLFIVLLAGLAACVLQSLSVRLGATTTTSLPHQTRKLILGLKEKYPKYRIALHGLLWFLYILAEIAIVATDLAELLGTAIALNLLFPKLPLFAGVLITAADSLIILLFFRSDHGRQGMLFFEVVIVTLVLCVFVCFMVLLHLIKPVWKDVFFGLVPSKTLVAPGALYVGVGIIGATVMPHALFLGSSLAGIDRLDMIPKPPTHDDKSKRSFKMPSLGLVRRLKGQPAQDAREEETIEMERTANRPFTDLPSLDDASAREGDTDSKPDILPPVTRKETEMEAAMRKYEAELKAFDRIRWTDLHISHATADTIVSLLGFALTINASILTLAGAAFYYQNSDIDPSDADLFGAHALIKSYIGNAAAIIFALALLCAGQSASITCTLAGQVVSEGFLNWKVSPFLRRIVTRCIGVIPAAIVAAAMGGKGLNTMLVASQVVLSVVLPTVIFPLVYLCSRKDIMTVLGPEVESESTRSISTPSGEDRGIDGSEERRGDGTEERRETVERREKSYISPKWVTVLGYLLTFVVLLANVYVFVQLGLGN